MKTEKFELNGLEGRKVPATLWLPDKEPSIVLQITHGMTEHMGRYEETAGILTENGIIVSGFDIEGHGVNSGDTEVASLGEGGWENAIDDMLTLNQYLKERFKNLRIVALGFSMGSFLLRDFLSKYNKAFDGAIIMGTGYQSSLITKFLKHTIKGQIKKVGFDATSDVIRKLSFEEYNKAFAPNRTDMDWLCSDEEELDRFIIDPLRKKDISAGLLWQMIDSMERTGNPHVYQTWNKKFPVLLISGENDPVGNSKKGVKAVYEQMLKGGLTNVRLKFISKGRHDILHEVCNKGRDTTILNIQQLLRDVILFY